MFTGIIEATGIIERIETEGSNKTFWISSPISAGFKVDQSVCHDGVCLTVEEIENNSHRVTAIDETLKKTNITGWKKNSAINLEQSMQMNARLDGHIVQGHVDTTARCINKVNAKGSWEYTFEFLEEFAPLIIEKGSISMNGTSLTIFNVTKTHFTVAIIPYTYVHTNINEVEKETVVNIEFDIIGKYVNRIQQLKSL